VNGEHFTKQNAGISPCSASIPQAYDQKMNYWLSGHVNLSKSIMYQLPLLTSNTYIIQNSL